MHEEHVIEHCEHMHGVSGRPGGGGESRSMFELIFSLFFFFFPTRPKTVMQCIGKLTSMSRSPDSKRLLTLDSSENAMNALLEP